jgi:hypothetical protein
MIALVAAFCMSADDPELPQLPPPRQMYLGGGLRISYSFSWGEPQRVYLLVGKACINECQGKAHFLHKTCDLSCDLKCREGTHIFRLAPYFHSFNIPYIVEREIPQAQKSLAPYIENMLQRISAEVGQRKKDDEVVRRIPCWNEAPCSSASKTMEGRMIYLDMTYQIFREVRNAEGGVSGIESVLGPSTTSIGDFIFGTGTLADSGQIEQCLCHAVTYDDEEDTFVDPGPGGETSPPPTTGNPPQTDPPKTDPPQTDPPKTDPPRTEPPPADPPQETGCSGVRFGSSEGTICSEQMLDKMQCEFTLDDMNGGTCTAQNPTSMPVGLFFPAGTWFDTDQDGVQDAVLIADVVLQVPASGAISWQRDPNRSWTLGSFVASNGQQPGKASAKLRVMCMEMTKKEPSPGVKYRPKRAQSPEFARIAQQIAKSPVRGPADQMKIWIYSDAATYAQIQEKLVPTPSEAQYVRALHDLFKLGVILDDPKYAFCFETRMLAAPASEAASAWFLEQMLRRNPRGVASWAAGAGKTRLLALLKDDAGAKHVARVANALCAMPDTSSQKAGLALLTAVPEASRALLANENLLAAWCLSWSDDAALAQQATQLMDAFNPPEETKEFVQRNAPAKG